MTPAIPAMSSSTFCYCFDSSITKGDEESLTKPLIEGSVQKNPSSWTNYPASNRPIITSSGPQDCILVTTGGNALQAVNPAILEQKNIVKVSVPDKNLSPGDTLVVIAPDGRSMEVEIPAGCGAGHVFFVQFPEAVSGVPVGEQEADELVIVPVHETGRDLELMEDEDRNKIRRNLVLVTVPEGVQAGHKIHVQLPNNGGIVEAIVPQGDVKQFYLQVPSSLLQEWLQHPTAYTTVPIVVGTKVALASQILTVPKIV